MRREIEWGWLAFVGVVVGFGLVVLWYALEAVNGW